LIHPSTTLRFIDERIGYGAVATELIPKGTIVWVHDELDQVFTPAQVERLSNGYRHVLDTYTFLNREGNRVLCWDLARYVNHSCDPNCLSPGLDLEVAVRDIAPGEPLTDDYAALNLTAAWDCQCGSPRCRGRVSSGDFPALARIWDEHIAAAWPLVGQVAQPLWPWVPDRDNLALALASGAALPSSLHHFFPRPPTAA
jgi:hypothetical protein